MEGIVWRKLGGNQFSMPNFLRFRKLNMSLKEFKIRT